MRPVEASDTSGCHFGGVGRKDLGVLVRHPRLTNKIAGMDANKRHRFLMAERVRMT
jgi:hypothetical protein